MLPLWLKISLSIIAGGVVLCTSGLLVIAIILIIQCIKDMLL